MAYTVACFFGLGFGCVPPGEYAGPPPGQQYDQNGQPIYIIFTRPQPYTGINLAPTVQNGLLGGMEAARRSQQSGNP